MPDVPALPEVRIELGESPIFTRVYVDGREFRGVTRVWFDSGELNDSGPRLSFRDRTRVHLTFYASDLLVTGTADVDAIEQRPVKVPA